MVESDTAVLRGPVLPTPGALGRSIPLPLNRVTLDSGLLASWQERNRAISMAQAPAKLRTSGNLENLDAARSQDAARFRGF